MKNLLKMSADKEIEFIKEEILRYSGLPESFFSIFELEHYAMYIKEFHLYIDLFVEHVIFKQLRMKENNKGVL